jgi:caspase domain-containing protein
MSAIAAAHPSAVKRRALLVGAAHYDHQDECPNLRTPEEDVRAVKRVLERPETGFEIAPPLIDPTRTGFASAVETMFTAAREPLHKPAAMIVI